MQNVFGSFILYPGHDVQIIEFFNFRIQQMCGERKFLMRIDAKINANAIRIRNHFHCGMVKVRFAIGADIAVGRFFYQHDSEIAVPLYEI